MTFFLTLSSSFTRSLDAARCLGVKSAISSLSYDAWTRYSHLASSRNTVNARFNRTFVLAVDLPNALAEPCFRHRNDFVDHQPRSAFQPDVSRAGNLSLQLGLGWAKSHSFHTGQTPLMKYNRALMMAVPHDRIRIARPVNATVIPMDQAPQDYADFDRRASQYSSSIPRVARRHVRGAAATSC